MQELFSLPFELEELGSRLAQLRESAGISQDTLAAKTGVSRYTQIKYEKPIGDKNHTFPSLEYVNKAHALGLDMYYVLTGKSDPSHQ